MAHMFFRSIPGLIKSQALASSKNCYLKFVRPITMQRHPYVPPNDEGYYERNAKLSRPLSPHLTIYKPQLTSMLSISHRITGIILTGYTVAFSLAAVYLELPMEHYIDHLKSAQVGSALLPFFKFALAFPLTYHFWNGIRHLFWDSGRFLTIKEVYITGYAVLAIALATAAILTSYSC